MISIRVEKLTKRFGTTTALREVSLSVAPGELFFLLGPSGCGKTTLLRTIAGFYIPEEGGVYFGDEDVTHLAPHKRHTAMMFQSYALWPHMTVSENVAFGLEERKVSKSETSRRVAEALDSVHMGSYARRRPNELSGGQQQRIALARALVVRPRCLLLDEPLSNLDARLRLEMRAEIRRVCKDFNLTTIYVTHDQKEALSIADRMAILENGRVLQIGAPAEIYRRPASQTVANFIGETDLIAGRIASVENGRARVETEIGAFEGVLGDPSARPSAGASATVSVRPECWRISSEPSPLNCVRGRIGASTYLGEFAQHDFMAGGIALKILELNPRSTGGPNGGDRFASAAPEDVVVLLE